MTELMNLAPAGAEITLAVGAMVLLMLGAFHLAGGPESDAPGWIAIAVLVGAGACIVSQSGETQRLFDGAFVVDTYARFMKLLILGGSAAAILLSFEFLRVLRLARYEIPVLILTATLGMLMMVSADDLIALYLGIELQSLSLYVLAAIRRNELRSSEAGLKYFVLGALSSGMLLYGASLLYGFTGVTGFEGIASVAQGDAVSKFGLIVGLVFLLVGLAFKVSAVPFHMWTPDVYEGAPTPITAFFAAAPKLAALALLARVLGSAFPNAVEVWQQIIVFLALASMLLGAFAAIGQTNIKRLLAYSSIGHVGFALVGLASGTATGIEALLVYLAIYLVMTLGTFAVVLSMRRGDNYVEDIGELAGLSQTSLSMAFVLAMLLFSLAGVPPLAGFFAKFYVFAAAVKAGLYPLAIIGVLSSVVGAFYYLRIIKIMFFDAPKEGFVRAELATRFVMTAAGLFILLYAVFPSPLINAAAAAAKSLNL
jgi:NADH-quinone oxidoreductase subunit N